MDKKQQKLARARAWKARNKDKVKSYRSKYHTDRKEEQNKKSAEWRATNLELYKEIKQKSDTKYRLENAEKIKASRHARKHKINAYQNERYATDPKYAMVKRLSASLNQSLRRARANKTTNTMKLVGCTSEELMVYLESQFLSGMTWENRRMWHIDHILPCASFDLTDPEQQKKCYHYSNLRPLWAKLNLAKGKRIIPCQCYPHSSP